MSVPGILGIPRMPERRTPTPSERVRPMPTRNGDEFFDRVERAANLHLALKACADPVRRFLLELLIPGDAYAGDLAASAAVNFGISTKRGSQHLQVLAEAGLVDVFADGSSRYYRLRPHGSEPVIEWLAQLG